MKQIPFDDMDGEIWFDGHMVPWRQAKVHVLTHGLHYGGSVFEGERVYAGKIFKLREHTERLIKSAAIIDMKIPFSVEELEKASLDTIKANNITEGYVRPVAWRGSDQMGITAQQATIHVAVAAWGWGRYYDETLREKGISMCTTEWRRPAPNTAPVHSKAAGLYMIGTMAKHDAERKGFNDALMLDYRGQVAEATGANLFMVKNGVIATPTPDCFLNGITRQTVIKMAKDMGFTVEERVIWPDELQKADEVFLTGTAAEITAVGKIDNQVYTVGPVTRSLRDAYEKMVRE